MKRIILTICISLSSLINAQTDSILFLGNSYTSTSALPNTFKSLAASGGKDVYIDSYTPGGKQLSQHYSDASSLGKINAKQWGFVVLQEQSQMPLIAPNTTISYAQAIALDLVKVNNNCTEVITYMTWAREAGNSWLNDISWTHEQMATYYEDFYEDIWLYVPGRVSPVGKAFHEATLQGLDVYSGDGSHQNSAGTYLGACVFYATIYKESPIGLSYTTQSTELTTQLQQIAHDIVMPDLYEHNINKVRFEMSAIDIDEGETVDFTERIWMEPFPNSFIWNLEGATSTLSIEENPVGVEYNNAGEYDVVLSVTDECGYQESRTYVDTISVSDLTSVSSLTKQSPFSKLYISSSSPNIELNSDFLNAQVNIYDIGGKLIKSTKNETSIYINSQNVGGYIIVEVLSDSQVFKEKVLVIK